MIMNVAREFKSAATHTLVGAWVGAHLGLASGDTKFMFVGGILGLGVYLHNKSEDYVDRTNARINAHRIMTPPPMPTPKVK